MATERTPLARADDDEVDYEDLIEKRPRKSRRKWYALLLMAMIGVGIFLGIYLTRDSSDNASSNVWDQIRLPSYIRPTHYNLTIDTDLVQSTFSGSIDAAITTTNETNVIICHVLELEIDNVNVTYVNGTSISVSRHFFVPQHQFLVIELSSTLLIGSYNVRIVFHAPLKNQLVGYYRSTYVTEDGKNHTLATTKFEPTHARRAFPCWDEPAFKATYDITLISHSGLTYISNMPIAKITPYPNARSMVTFQRSVRMSSYLVVFIVSDFTSLPSVQSHSKLFPNDNKTISVYTNAARLNQTKLALQVASLVLAHFEDYFGIPYPLPKLDLIAIPDFQSGAMENWGAITFRETSLLYDETQSSASDMQAIITTISHEISHQWFGNLVTMSWWDGLWLNEGFASYMEYLGASAVYPKLGLLDQFISTDLNNALTLDASVNSHPIVQQVTDPNQINQLFDSISYDKGASVIRMMVGFLGEETFVKGLKSYLQTHAFGNAESSDLWNAMTAATNGAVPVGEIMDTWTKQMGFPLLSVERTSNITAVVTGATHRFVVGDNPNPGKFSWYIPISSVTSRGESPSTFYKPTQESIALPVSASDSWIKLNRNGTAVYRTKYDNITLAGLATALFTRDPVLSVTDRTQLLSDVWALAAQGSGDYPTALSFSQFLPSERSYPVWVIALSQLRTLSSLLSSSAQAQPHWERYLNHTLTPITDYVGWNKSEEHQTSLLQGIILKMAITNNISDSRHQALLRWNISITSNTTIDANIRDAVYLEAIRSDSRAWNYMWECYRTNSVVSVALKCLQSMATSSNVQQLSWLLNATVDGSIRSQDALTVIRLVASNPVGQRLAWTFVQRNWDTLYATFVQGGGRTFGPMIGSIISEYSTQKDYDDISAYLKDRDVGPGASSVSDGLASILRRIQWLQKNEEIVVAWLKAH